MKFILTVQMDGAAFEGANASPELRGILKEVSGRLIDFDGRPDRGAIMDVNGNTCGTWRIS